MKITELNTSELVEYENNAKKHPQEQIDQIINSIKQFGFNDPIAIDENNVIIEGHGRKKAAEQMGLEIVPVIKLEHMNDNQKKAYILAHNKLTMNTDFDLNILNDELADLEDFIDMSDLGFEDLFTEEIEDLEEIPKIEDSFDVSPFSIILTYKKNPKNIKKYYESFGLNYAETREKIETFENNDQFDKYGFKCSNSVSIFNPFYAHVGYKYFGRSENSSIIDPFAGGVVRGHVADVMGHKYTGVDLRQEQIDTNINCGLSQNIKYICGDSTKLYDLIGSEKFNLSFSCPPYADLEVYSDNPNDLSNVSHEEFFILLEKVYLNVFNALDENSFCVIVLGDVRDKNGMYINLIGKTKEMMRGIGFGLYNDIIIGTPLGTSAMRAGKAMKNRKITKVHEHMLVFYKGDSKNIQKYYNDLRLKINEDEFEDMLI